MTGCNFSPSSTASSVTRFLALSNPACTVLFCTSYSSVTDVASWKAFAASCCSYFIISRLPANAEITWAARAPFSPMSLNTGASTSMLPNECNCSSSISNPSLVLRVTVSLNFCAFSPVALMIWSCCLNISIITFDTAVEDISTFCPCESSTAASPMISGMVIRACAPTPAMRCAKFARYGADAVQFCESSLMTEPTASRAFSVPSLSSSPKMFVSFDSVSVAPSPNSSRATFI